MPYMLIKSNKDRVNLRAINIYGEEVENSKVISASETSFLVARLTKDSEIDIREYNYFESKPIKFVLSLSEFNSISSFLSEEGLK